MLEAHGDYATPLQLLHTQLLQLQELPARQLVNPLPPQLPPQLPQLPPPPEQPEPAQLLQAPLHAPAQSGIGAVVESGAFAIAHCGIPFRSGTGTDCPTTTLESVLASAF
jgi:hypothetical protein